LGKRKVSVTVFGVPQEVEQSSHHWHPHRKVILKVEIEGGKKSLTVYAALCEGQVKSLRLRKCGNWIYRRDEPHRSKSEIKRKFNPTSPFKESSQKKGGAIRDEIRGLKVVSR